MSNENGTCFSLIGNMLSGSQDPVEGNRALDREAERKRREQEKGQARLLKEQQAAQQREWQKNSSPPVLPKPVVMADKETVPLPEIDHEDPLGAIPEEKRRDIMLHKYDNHRNVTSIFGQSLSPDKRIGYVHTWKKRITEAAPGVLDVLLEMNITRDPAIRRQVEQAGREYRQWLPKPKARTPETGRDVKNLPPDGLHTLEYRPERDGMPAAIKTIPYASEPASAEKAGNISVQTAHVNDLQDVSMGPFFEFLNKNAIAPMEGNGAWKNNTVGHADESYIQATDALVENINHNLGMQSKYNGQRPAGEPDQSYGPAIGDVSENMGLNSAVTGKGRQVIGPPNMTMWQNWNTEESRDIPYTLVTDGVKQAANDAKILFLSASVVAGKTLYDLIGGNGDPIAIRKTQRLLDHCQEESRKTKPLAMNEIYIEGDPEKTMQNVTRYLYQELGNQLVRVPACFFLGKLDTIAQLTGVTTAVMAAQLHADIRKETGESRVGESVMYAIPLGLMSGMLWPLREAIKFKGPKEAMDYVASMVSSAAVHKVQDVSKGMVVNKYKDSTQRNN